jgi:hypothetical protein
MIAPVGSHFGHRPLAFALRSSYQSLTCVRGSSARGKRNDTIGRWVWEDDMMGMDGWMDRLLITTVDALNVELERRTNRSNVVIRVMRR